MLNDDVMRDFKRERHIEYHITGLNNVLL